MVNVKISQCEGIKFISILKGTYDIPLQDFNTNNIRE